MTRGKKKPKSDLDLSKFREVATIKHPQLDKLSQIPLEDQDTLLKSGIDITEKDRSGSFFQRDHSVIHCRTDLKERRLCLPQKPAPNLTD